MVILLQSTNTEHLQTRQYYDTYVEQPHKFNTFNFSFGHVDIMYQKYPPVIHFWNNSVNN